MAGTTIQPFISIARYPAAIAAIIPALIAGDIIAGQAVAESDLANVTVCENTQHDVWQDPAALVKKGCGDCADLVRAIGATRGTHVGCAAIPDGGFHVALGDLQADGSIVYDDVCVLHGSTPFPQEVYEAMIWYPIDRPDPAVVEIAQPAAVAAIPISFEAPIWDRFEEVVAAVVKSNDDLLAERTYKAAQVLSQLRESAMSLISSGVSPASAISTTLDRATVTSNNALDGGSPKEEQDAIDRAIVSLDMNANGNDAEVAACAAKGDESCQAIAIMGAMVAQDLSGTRVPSAMSSAMHPKPVKSDTSIVKPTIKTSIASVIQKAGAAIRKDHQEAIAERARAMIKRRPGCGGSCGVR